MNSILVGMIEMFGNLIRNVVDDDDPVEHDQDDEHQYSQGNVIKYHRFLPS